MSNFEVIVVAAIFDMHISFLNEINQGNRLCFKINIQSCIMFTSILRKFVGHIGYANKPIFKINGKIEDKINIESCMVFISIMKCVDHIGYVNYPF